MYSCCLKLNWSAAIFTTLSDSEIEDLVSAASNGNQSAQEKLLLECNAWIVKRIQRQLRPKVRSIYGVDDVLQMVWVDAFRSFGSLRARTANDFAGWIRSITDHRTLDTIRGFNRQKRGGKLHRANRTSIWHRLSAGVTTPSRKMSKCEADQELREAIADLQPEYARVLILHYLQGKSIDETSRLMKRSVGSVRGLLDRSRKELARKLSASPLIAEMV